MYTSAFLHLFELERSTKQQPHPTLKMYVTVTILSNTHQEALVFTLQTCIRSNASQTSASGLSECILGCLLLYLALTTCD